VAAPIAERASVRGELIVTLALFVVLASVVFVPHLSGGRVFSFRDLFDYAIPLKLFSVAEIQAGRLPLWNPYSFFGFPHLANLQSGVLYPPNLLLLLGFPLGFNLSLVLHYVLAAVGAAVLARLLGNGLGASRIAGVAYGFAPFVASLNDLNAYLFTCCWLPWLVVCGLRLGERVTALRIAASAVVFAVAFLAGEPQTMAVGSLLAAAASAVGSPRRLPALAAAWAAAGLIALLLVAPVLLPFLELVSVSDRAGDGLTDEQIYQHSLTPPELANLFLPGFGGDVVQGTHWLGEQTYVRCVYVGVIVLVLAALGGAGAARFRAGLVVLALGGLLLALGPDGLLYPALLELGFRQSRFPVKFLILSLLALSLLAAAGWDRLWRAADQTTLRRALGSVLGVGAIAALTVAVAAGGPARAAGLHVVLVVGVAAVAISWRLRRPLSHQPIRLLAVVLVADLVVAGAPVLTTAPAAELVATVPEIDALLADRGDSECPAGRTFNPAITAESLAWVHPDRRYDSIGLARKKSLLFGNLHLLWGLAVVRGGESVEISWTSDVVSLLDRGPSSRHLVDLVGAGRAVSLHDLEPFGFEEIAAASARVWRNPDALPRAFFVERAVTVVSRNERLARLAAGRFEPAAVAILEAPVALDRGCGDGRAAIRRCPSDVVAIDVESPGRCLLVVTDTWYPGWVASVDGRAAELVRVDHAFRGVVVPEGASTVEMEYRPASFALGVRLAGFGLVLAIGCVAWGVVRRERSSGASGRSTCADA